MGQSCAEGQYLDRLVLRCVSCSVLCHNSIVTSRCSDFCVAWRCKAVSGQFYDTLLKKCLRCSEVCGSHPSACAHACAKAVTRRPVGGGVSAVALVTGRGRAVSRASLPSEALVYALLGFCITALVFSLTAGVLLLLRRTKHRQLKPDTRKKQQPNRHGQSSNDSLMAQADEVSQEGNVNHERAKATENCVHCFSEHTIYQQAHGHHDDGPLHTHPDRNRTIRIICSPTQSSM